MSLYTVKQKFRVKKKKKNYTFEEKRHVSNNLHGKFKKGEKVIYTRTELLAEILAVHFDDYPNIYYTIKILNNNDNFLEKQTPENNLKKFNQ